MLKLNLGCGQDIRVGWQNIDKYALGPGVTEHDVRGLASLFGPNKADEILAQDVLEHLPHKDIAGTIKEWCRILAPGGMITIQVPDVKKQMQCLLDGTWSVPVFNHMFFGEQNHQGNFHTAAITEEFLREMLEENGVEVKTIAQIHQNLRDSIRGWNANLRIVGVKK